VGLLAVVALQVRDQHDEALARRQRQVALADSPASRPGVGRYAFSVSLKYQASPPSPSPPAPPITCHALHSATR
jgi:hypothetical protein